MKGVLKKLAIVVGVVLVAYFAMVEVNTWLGKRALKKTGLQIHGLEDAFKNAQAESKLVLADLSAIWCPSCRALDSKVLADEDVKAAINKDYIFARIEYESKEGEAFQNRYGVSGFPNLLILDPKGKLVRQLPLVFDPVAFKHNLENP